MVSKKILSIITITYQNEDGLRKTYRSFTKNDDMEWIVIDGGSTDQTTDFLRKTDAKWVSEKDKCIYDAMNKGIAFASAPYVIFMNAGDCFADIDTPARLIEVIKKESPDFIYGDAYEEKEGGEWVLKEARDHEAYRYGQVTHHQAMVYRKDALKGFTYDLSYKIAADYDLTCRFLMEAKKIYRLNVPICIFEYGGISQTQTVLGRREELLIRKNLHLVNPLRNYLIYARQTMGSAVKSRFPAAYWFIRKCFCF